MTFEEFEILQRQMFADIEKIGAAKGIEYASDRVDRLANFNRIAKELEMSPAKVGWVYFKKHLDAIQTYLRDGKEYSEEGIRGRFLDAINYLTLIYSLIAESKNDELQKFNSDPSGYIHYEVKDCINEPESTTSFKVPRTTFSCEKCGRGFNYHEKLYFNSNGDLVHDNCVESKKDVTSEQITHVQNENPSIETSQEERTFTKNK